MSTITIYLSVCVLCAHCSGSGLEVISAGLCLALLALLLLAPVPMTHCLDAVHFSENDETESIRAGIPTLDPALLIMGIGLDTILIVIRKTRIQVSTI